MEKQQKDMYINKIIQIVLILAVLVLLVLLLRSCEATKELGNLYESVNDSVRVERNEKGQEIARNKLLEANRVKDLLNLKTKDSTVLWLQAVAKEYKGKLQSAIVVANSTSTVGGSITTIEKWDTAYSDTGKIIYPQYTSTWMEQWSEGNIRATKDSIFRDIKVKNEFEITFGKENNGWFKKRESEVKITNLNPNTTTTELKAFNVVSKQKRITLGLQVGCGMTAFGLTPYVGLGANFTILGIK